MRKNGFFKISIFAFAMSALCLRGADVNVEKLTPKSATATIQAAIDMCSRSGGGVVYLPDSGTFLCSTIEIKTGVTLNIPKNLTLKANPEGTASKKFIFAKNAENVGVCGGGTLDGNGSAYGCSPNQKAPRHPNRAQLLRFEECKNVRINNVKLLDSSTWTLNLKKCDTVFVTNVHMKSLANHNNDGIDVGSRNVIISNCILETGDDTICFKTHSRDEVIENVAITNCVLSSNCNVIKFGTASYGQLRNITISNCTISNTSYSKIFNWAQRRTWANISQEICGISGICITAVDGGSVDGVVFSNITMRGIQTPIFIRVGHRKNFIETESRGKDEKPEDDQKSFVKNVLINSVIAESVSSISNSITAVSGHTLKNITLRDVMIIQRGLNNPAAAKSALEKKLSERPASYPENDMFKVLPAYGFFTRNVQNLRFDNLQICYTDSDARPAFVFENSDVRIFNSQWQKPSGDVKSIILRGGSKLVEKDNIERSDSFLN